MGGRLAAEGGSDVFVAALSPSGATRWASRFGGLRDDEARAVAIDPGGDVVIAGAFRGAASFGRLRLTSASAPSFWSRGRLDSGGDGPDVFVARLTPAGAPRWAQRFGGTGWDFARAVGCGPEGDVVLLADLAVALTPIGGGIAETREQVLVDRGP